MATAADSSLLCADDTTPSLLRRVPGGAGLVGLVATCGFAVGGGGIAGRAGADDVTERGVSTVLARCMEASLMYGIGGRAGCLSDAVTADSDDRRRISGDCVVITGRGDAALHVSVPGRACCGLGAVGEDGSTRSV